MNKTVEAIKNGQNVATEELFEVVNSYVLTTLSLRTPDKQRIMSMKVNHYENACGCYEFTQTCQLLDDVAYSLKPDELVSVRGEYNNKADAFYITCELKNGMEMCQAAKKKLNLMASMRQAYMTFRNFWKM